MRKHSLTHQHLPFFSAGVLAAYFSYRRTGFRQKDVRFMVELFSNWMEATIGDTTLPLQNVQVSRYLEGLRERGILKRARQDGTLRYSLTRVGLRHLLTGLVDTSAFLPLEHVFFVYYFLKSYGLLFESLLSEEDLGLSRSFRADLQALRNPKLVLQNQLRFLEKEIKKLESRIQEAREAAGVGEKMLAKGERVEVVAAEIQRKFPYELNSRKPLKELIAEIPEAHRPWEMTVGLRHRAEHLWVPLKQFLEHNCSVLRTLESSP